MTRLANAGRPVLAATPVLVSRSQDRLAQLFLPARLLLASAPARVGRSHYPLARLVAAGSLFVATAGASAVLVPPDSLPLPVPGVTLPSGVLPAALSTGGDLLAEAVAFPASPAAASSVRAPIPSLRAFSEPALSWVKTVAPTPLWSSPYPDATMFTEIPSDSLLNVQGGEKEGRLPVYYFGDGYLRQPGFAWVDRDAALAVPQPSVDDFPILERGDVQILPHWVQTHKDTTFWSSPHEDAEAFTDLPQWSYLEVQGQARNGRMLAYYYGDYGSRQAGLGWVDETAVGTAGYPGRWMRNHSPSALWSGPDDNAERFGELPQWSWLRIVEGAPASPERVLVYFFGDGRERQPGPAWVPLQHVGPVTPPSPLPQLPGPEQVPGLVASPQHAFIAEIVQGAQASQRSTGVPASVAVAQAILESNWGRSRLAREGKNLFGIKASGGPGSAGTIAFPTWEYLNGHNVVVQATFRAYATWENSIRDHGEFLRRNQRYSAAFDVTQDPRAFARAIHSAGYATDPAYSNKLIQLMDRYNLYQFDVAG